uniref:Uncharacterized protein n=1 Tax=Arundo donax TaxID=35708 RepID=A0A0A9A2K0_ARUDO
MCFFVRYSHIAFQIFTFALLVMLLVGLWDFRCYYPCSVLCLL